MEYLRVVTLAKTTRSLCFGIALVTWVDWVCADVAEPKDHAYYKVILVRNPFDLKDPPPPPPVETTNVAPVKLDVKFTGITAHSGGKKAWFMIPPQPGKTKDPKYLSMSEGEKEGDLQVLEIDEKEATVKILNAGVPVVLNFKEYGLAAPTALAVPGPVSAPAPGVRALGINPAVPPPAGTYVPPGQASASASVPQSATEVAANAATRTIPSRNLRTTPIDNSASHPTVDPVAQYIQMQASGQAARQKGLSFPPIPPVPGVPAE